MGPCRIIFFFCKMRALRGIKQHSPACLITIFKKPLLQTPLLHTGLFWSLLWALSSKKTSSSLISSTLNKKMNIYSQCPTNVSFPASIRIHRNYIMSEHKVNRDLPLPLFLARSSGCLGSQKESEHAETLGQRE